MHITSTILRATIILAIGSSIQANDIAPIHSRFLVDAVITQLFEMIRRLIKNGSSEKGIPVLDPYAFDFAHIDKSGEVFSIRINVTHGSLTGLGDFKIVQSDFNKNELSIELDMTIPMLKFRSDYYEMEGNLVEAVPIEGKGTFEIEAHKFNFWSKIFLKQSDDGKSILIKSLEKPGFHIESIKSHIEFDNNIDGIFNAMIEDLLADYLTCFNQFILATYSERVIAALNPLLNKFESWRIIAVILN